MAGSADANLLLAAIEPSDALHARAVAHLSKVGRLRASHAAVLETMMVLHRRGRQTSLVLMLEKHFDLDNREVLRSAADALDRGLVKTPFDAYHLADALARGEPLHTADKELLVSAFPTVAY